MSDSGDRQAPGRGMPHGGPAGDAGYPPFRYHGMLPEHRDFAGSIAGVTARRVVRGRIASIVPEGQP